MISAVASVRPSLSGRFERGRLAVAMPVAVPVRRGRGVGSGLLPELALGAGQQLLDVRAVAPDQQQAHHRDGDRDRPAALGEK